MAFEVGERVTFRSLQWEVEDTSIGSALTLFGRDRANRGYRARVILGLEPIERTAIPPVSWTVGAPQWDPLKWRALHSAFRLTLSHGRGNLAAVDWGRLILEPYQLVPLQRIENLPFARLLIADDTGLGKTAEAGLILFRLLQKRRADRILVLCRAQPEPERWRDEMKEKFGIDLTVINDGDDYARLRREIPAHLNAFGHLSRVVMSMYFAAPSKRGSQIVDDLAKVRWDVVVMDEAHHLARHGDGGKRLSELGETVAGTADALLLLTATPHDGKGESYASLLRLLDPYLVVDPDRLDPELVRPLVVRRLKARVVKADGSRFLRRKIHPLEVEGSKAENWLDRGLRGYCKQLRQRGKQFADAGERYLAMGATFLETFLRKRLASSAYACRLSLERRLNVLKNKAEPVGDKPPREDRDDRAVYADEMVLPSGKAEAEIVRDLIARAQRIPDGGEAKVQALTKLVATILSEPAEKVVVFTEFVDTLDMLTRVFTGEGWVEAPVKESERPENIGRGLYFRYEGETPARHRESIRRQFLSDPAVRILLATDAASESINLHKGCNHLIHLETVWNPNRYEQRNGRIDRYGQTRRPQIYLLINAASIDERVAKVGYRKLERIAEDLGSVSNVLPLAARIDVDEFLEQLGEGEVERAEAEMERRLDKAERQVRGEEESDGTADLIRGESFEAHELQAVNDALAGSREFVPEFSDVQEFLGVYLRAESSRLEGLPAEHDVYAITVPSSLRAEVGAERIPRGTFRRDLAVREIDTEEAERVEFLSPGHPLVRAALRRARGWIFQSGFASRVAYRRVAASVRPGYLFTYASRFLDGRGEAVEERFEAVFIGLDGTPSTDPDADLRLFRDPGVGGNLSDAEEAVLKRRFASGFGRAMELAARVVRKRAETRTEELLQVQRRIMQDAFFRLGRWRQAAEDRLRRRLAVEGPAVTAPRQLDLEGHVRKEIAAEERERARRLRRFNSDLQKLLADEHKRRADIECMEHVRLDTIDPIGALALVPEAAR